MTIIAVVFFSPTPNQASSHTLNPDTAPEEKQENDNVDEALPRQQSKKTKYENEIWHIIRISYFQ